jgi:GntR family transcriptional regulator/MocR family aminotransferase
VRVRGIAAGLHALVELPVDGPGEAEVVALLARQHVGVQGLGPYWHCAEGHQPGLVVGFGTPPEHAFSAALAALTSALGAIYLR